MVRPRLSNDRILGQTVESFLAPFLELRLVIVGAGSMLLRGNLREFLRKQADDDMTGCVRPAVEMDGGDNRFQRIRQ